jgi:FtsP/CotA-like multicopper oxidase with cupredoxin domain
MVEPAVDADRTFVLDDVDLETNGAIRIEPSPEDLMLGRRGDTMLVNGATLGRVTAARNAIERWRFVNTSNGRFFDLSIGRTMRVIGWDGGLVATPYDVDHLVIAPGERYEVLVTIDAAMSIATLDVDRGEGLVDTAAELVRIEIDGEVAARELPDVAGNVPPLVATGQTLQFRLKEDLDGQAGAVFFINDERWPFNVPIDVQLGDVATWEIVNDNDHAHPFHIHGHFAQVLDTDGVAEPNLGWKDTIQIAPRSTVRAVLRYEAAGKWMAHCQIPEHAERGMTADVNVIP